MLLLYFFASLSFSFCKATGAVTNRVSEEAAFGENLKGFVDDASQSCDIGSSSEIPTHNTPNTATASFGIPAGVLTRLSDNSGCAKENSCCAGHCALLESDGNVGPATLWGTIRIYGRQLFHDEFGGLSPCRNVLVEIWDEDGGDGDISNDDFLASGWTDSNGYFDITAPNTDELFFEGADPYVKFIAMGSDWRWVDKTAGDDTVCFYYPAFYFLGWHPAPIDYNIPDGWEYDCGNLAPTEPENSVALQAGDALFEEAQWIFDRTGWRRSLVTINYPWGDAPSTDGNSIDLPEKPVTSGSWNDVKIFNLEARCIMYNLYGHFPTGWAPPVFRAVYSETSDGFAITQGWAEFMQCAVGNDINSLVGSYNGHGGNIESNDWYNCMDTGDMDGAIVEGSIASVLWDILDPANEPRDLMDWGFDEIFFVFRYYQPESMDQFWNSWKARWPTISNSMGPLCSIYWAYGIDKDTYPPTGTVLVNSGASYTTSRTVSLSVTGNDWGSNLSSMRFSEDASTWSPWFPFQSLHPVSYSITSPDDGVKFIDMQLKDVKGLISAAGSIYDDIILDTVPPTGSVIINNGNPTYTNSVTVTLYLSYSDATSGVDKVRYSNDGTWDTETWESPSATKAWSLAAGSDGSRTTYYQIRDKAGLLSPTYSDTIILDTVAPVTTIIHSSGSYTVALSATDSLSGVKTTYYRLDLGSWITYTGPFTLTGTGTHTIDCYSRDNALNNEAIKQLIVHYLTVNTNPLGITNIPGTGWYNHGENVTVTAPTTVVYQGTTYTFSTWTLDGPPEPGNPIFIRMLAPHTATAVYNYGNTYAITIKAHCNTEGADVSVSITKDGALTPFVTPWTFASLTGTHTFTVPSVDANGHEFKQWSTGQTSTTITVNSGDTLTAYYEKKYTANIAAYTFNETASLSVSITKDGVPTGYSTPHSFSGLTDTHTFTVPTFDTSGTRKFAYWSTGETSTTITVTSGGTYTAYYETTYSALIKAHCNNEDADISVSITEDGAPTGRNTPYTFSGLTSMHTFTVPSADAAGHKFKQWSTGSTSTTITVTSGGTYTAYYETTPTFTIWTDKTNYRIGNTMKVYVRVTNPLPLPALRVRAIIKLQLPNQSEYGPLLDMITTLPVNFDSGTVLWNQFTLPSAPYGSYKWIAELRNPTTGALYTRSTYSWQLGP